MSRGVRRGVCAKCNEYDGNLENEFKRHRHAEWAKYGTIHGSISAFIDLHVKTAGRCQPRNQTHVCIRIYVMKSNIRDT
jgi:hypothetical protein